MEFSLLPFSMRINITPDCNGYGGDQSSPAIASDSGGNLAIAWEDARNGHADVFVQFYARGVKVGKNQKVNESPVRTIRSLENWAGSPERPFSAMHVNRSGSGVIVWRQSRTELRARLFDISTATLGREFSAYAGPDQITMVSAGVQVLSDASFVISWSRESADDGAPNYMRYLRFSSAGEPLSPVRLFHGYRHVEPGSTPILALPDDRIVALVSANIGDHGSEFLEFIDRDGTLLPGTIEVFESDPDILHNSYGRVTAAVNTLGQVFCARVHTVNDDGNIHVQRKLEWRIFDCRSGEVTPMQSREVGYGHDLQALRDTGTGFQLYWTDPDPDHAIARIDTTGAMHDLRRFDHGIAGPAHFQFGEPLFLRDPGQGMFTVWTIRSSESWTNRVTHLGLTRNVPGTLAFEDLGFISDDVCGAMEVKPSVFANGHGRYLACWHEYPAGITMLHCQVLDERLEAVGPVIVPSVDAETEFSGVLDAAATPDGSFLLVYRGVDRSGMGGLYLQRIDPGGGMRGQSVRLDDTTYSHLPLTIACAEDGTVTVGYLDQGYGNTHTVLVRLVWNDHKGIPAASKSMWPVLMKTRTLTAMDGNERGDLLLATSEYDPESVSKLKDLTAVIYSSDGREDTVITRPKGAPLLESNDWYQLECAINENRDVALCWTQVRYEGDRCIDEESWYVEPSLLILRAYAETEWNQWLESFPLRMNCLPAVTLQSADAGGFLCTWSVADSCKGVRYDDASQVRETMAFHLASSSELPTLDQHRAHSVLMDRQHACFLFESNDESGHGFDVHGKIFAFENAATDHRVPFSFDVFPASATDYAVARFVLTEESRVIVRILDVLGRELRTRDAGILAGGGHFLNLPIEGLAAGSYLVSLTAHEQAYRSFVVLPHR